MSEQENLEIIKRQFEALNSHDLDHIVSMQDEGFVWENDVLPNAVLGREITKQTFQMYFHGIPDLHYEAVQMLASGDYVTVRWTASGTHKGELMGVPPTNRRVEVNGCGVYELKNGKITHLWSYWDTGYLMKQLGVFTSPGQA